MHLKLKRLIDTRKAVVTVIGLGYVGLPIALEFAKKGFLVYGLDNNSLRIDTLMKGRSYITDILPKEIRPVLKNKKFLPTTENSILEDSDIIIICVPTPLRKRRVPNISYIIKASRTIAKHLRPGQLIVLESTTYPGTTRDVVLPTLEKSGLKEGKEFFLAFSPERIDPGNKRYVFSNIPKVVGGISREAGQLAEKLYSKVVDKVIPVIKAESAEVVKLLENTFRITNIGLINEFAMLCDKLKIDVWEVVEAAKTKPFGFMPFYPGPGLGGHCLGSKEYIFVQNSKGVEATTVSSFVDKISSNPLSAKKCMNGVLYVKPPVAYKMLTFDMQSRTSKFHNITMLSKRYTDNSIYKIVTSDNRRIDVTDMHPMLIESNGSLKLKYAKDLKTGDQIPSATAMEYRRLRPNDNQLSVDLVDNLKNKPELVGRIRVRLRNAEWKQYKDCIYKLQFESPYYTDYIRYNSLPLKYYLEAEEKGFFTIKHSDLLLCTGRGSSYSEIPAVIKIGADFSRLIGYYLSEGCITKDESIRTRFSFNADEKEYISDVCDILTRLGLKYSIYKSRQWKSSCIKVSSEIFGILFRDILKCGTNCYNMKIPDIFFIMPKEYKWELLKGLFRGDGGVDTVSGRRTYTKNGREYCHYRNSCCINYFSSSSKLFQQIVLLLQEFGICPTFNKKRKGLLLIFGYKQISKFKNVFLGDKKQRIDLYLRNKRKIIGNKGFQRHKGFVTSAVKTITKNKGGYVYSAEVDNTHTIVTSYGTIVHNCIPADPLYLSWKARKVGFRTKMIDLASKTNLFMPHYVLQRIERLLEAKGRAISASKILILGVTYKKDVKDLRESPALDIIELLHKKRAKVSYYDPYIPNLKINSIDLKRIELTRSNLKKQDLVILVTAHEGIDYRMVVKNAKLIFDTRNAFSMHKVKGNNIVKL